MNKKSLGIIIIAIILLPFFIFLINAKLTAFNINFYEKEFLKYDPEIENKTQITENLINYLKNQDIDESYISPFEQDEINHLIDVKILMHRFLLILNLTILFILISITTLYFINKKDFLKNLSLTSIFGGILTLLITLITYLIIKDFQTAFTRFHEIFFKLGNWQFPSNYKLVTLFPAEFWIDIINKILTNIIISANILILVGILIFIIIKKRQK